MNSFPKQNPFLKERNKTNLFLSHKMRLISINSLKIETDFTLIMINVFNRYINDYMAFLWRQLYRIFLTSEYFGRKIRSENSNFIPKVCEKLRIKNSLKEYKRKLK